MKAIGFLVILVLFLATKAEENKRVKRGQALFEFAKMIKCATGRSWWHYNGYGCSCGTGGIKGTAVDETDQCCEEHDDCYDKLVQSGTCKRNAWKKIYTWYKRVGCYGCSSSNRGCGKKLCLCDRTAAKCFQQAQYHSSYKGYDRSRCFPPQVPQPTRFFW